MDAERSVCSPARVDMHLQLDAYPARLLNMSQAKLAQKYFELAAMAESM